MSSVVFNNVHLNFSFDTNPHSPRIETTLYQWARSDLSKVFDSVFEKTNIDDAELYLGNIDFDLGDIPENSFLPETCSRLKEKLEQLLHPRIENQRRSTYLEILINSCKKVAPEIKASQIEDVFSRVFQAEESKETIIKNTISILRKQYPVLSLDEISEDVFNELKVIKHKKKNVYLLNILEKLYSSFSAEQPEPFIQSFFTATTPHYFSDGYLDLLKHFVLKMQDTYPDFNKNQSNRAHTFKPSGDKNSVNLKQILNDICISVLPSDSSAFIDDFIKKTRESKPFIPPLGIIILFIEELKKKYPHLNNFRLSNFNEKKSPKLSKNHWKNEIREILWNIYKPILQAETTSFESTSFSNGPLGSARYSTSEHGIPERHHSERSTFEGNNKTLEHRDAFRNTQNQAEKHYAEKLKFSKADDFVHEKLDNKSSSCKNITSERYLSEQSAFESNNQNRERRDAFRNAQNQAEKRLTEKFRFSKADDTEHEISENRSNKHFPFEANAPQIQASELFDKTFNDCFAEFSSPEKQCSPLQITESFISKLRKSCPNKDVLAHVVKAYQKATELEMKYNSAADDNDEISVKDAGLVLIGAYIPTLFKKLEYVADGTFVSDQARMKACRLLRYIVFGDLPSDGLYFLGNYFCGFPWNYRIPSDIVLDENDKNIAESLIKSVIENWKAIGHVSIDGFRGTFLHREGFIEKENDDEIYLKVKKGPFDMLLDKLPWSYSMLKFKWHKKLLSTIWR